MDIETSRPNQPSGPLWWKSKRNIVNCSQSENYHWGTGITFTPAFCDIFRGFSEKSPYTLDVNNFFLTVLKLTYIIISSFTNIKLFVVMRFCLNIQFSLLFILNCACLIIYFNKPFLFHIVWQSWTALSGIYLFFYLLYNNF